MPCCEYCGKDYKNVRLHKTKTHTVYKMYWKTVDESWKYELHKFVKIIDGVEVVAKQDDSSFTYYFDDEVKLANYYETTDVTLYGHCYRFEYNELKVYIGYTCGFSRTPVRPWKPKNQIHIVLRKRPRVAPS